MSVTDRVRGRKPAAAAVGAVAMLAAAGAASAALGSFGAERPSLPGSLQRVEMGSEDIIDLALREKRGLVVFRANRLRTTAHGAAAEALRDVGAPAGAVAELERRTDRLAALAPKAPFLTVALAANHVFELVPRLFARFGGRVPPTVLGIDQLEFEAKLRSLAGEQAVVRKTVQKLARSWAAFREEVVAVGADSVTRKFDTHVAAMKRLAGSSDRKALQAEANHGLDLVDVLEGVFRRSR